MNANILKDGEFVVFRLEGHLDYDSFAPLQKSCEQHFKQNKVIFNLAGLSFVGSMGITPFVSTLAQLSRSLPQGVKFVGVSSEFRRVFESEGIEQNHFCDDEERAKVAFVLAPVIPVPEVPPVQQ